jgi:uncharacterized protein YbjT (DUF2867 family)
MMLVTGGRGRIARETVARLREAGQRVRVASRRPAELDFPTDVEVVQADAQTTDWSSVLDAVTSALLYADPFGVESFVDTARSANVAHITLVSAAGIDSPTAADSDPLVRMHRAAEEAVQASGVPWTFLRPGPMAANTLGWAESIRAERVVRVPYPNAHAALIHEADIADIAALIMIDTEHPHDGKCYKLSGPESLTQHQQVQHIAAAIGDDVQFEEVTPEQYHRTMRQWVNDRMDDTLIKHLLDDSMIDKLIERLQRADGRPDTISPTFQTLTGRAGRPFAQWANDHADAFR